MYLLDIFSMTQFKFCTVAKLMEYKHLFLCCLLGSALSASALGPGRTLGLKAPYLSPDTPLPEAKWIDQKLDHFAPAGTTTYWKQRYFVNTTWFDGEGPVFLFLGGEGPASPAWLIAETNIMVMTRKFSGLAFYVEHRFYGESHPTDNVSLSSLKYLSSRQALADFAYFNTLMAGNGLYNISSKNKWVAIGGSYSGALASWLRQSYPNIVVGAVASSAPVLAKLDYVEYVEVTAASLGTSSYGKACPDSVLEAFSAISIMLQDKSQWPAVEKLFNVWPALKTSMDVTSLMENLARMFEGVVQYNRDNGGPDNITILCSFMANDSLGSALDRLVHLNNAALNFADYNAMVKSMSATGWDSGTAQAGERQWVYQTCTEFAYFQTTNSLSTHIFSSLISLDYYLDICLQVFNISSDAVAAAVDATNQYYGGRNVTGTNIVFPNGSIDQWHALSVTSDLSDTVKAVFIDGTAHCADMNPPSDHDLKELVMARTEISMAVQAWITTTS